MNRCVNIDWLEVFVSEPSTLALDADYFKGRGYFVKVRDYGTPQYREMFVIYEHDRPFVEVRRNPYSVIESGGIFHPNDCHLRLSNRACYAENPVASLRSFLLAHNYCYKSLSRIDICMDFNFFDLGDLPARVLENYMKGKLSKINQCNIGAHGKDSFTGRRWNSLSWGSKNSMVSTKMYNKSLELKENRDKFYIRDAWAAAGLDLEHDVWRVEFSIKSDLKHLVRVRSYRNVNDEKESEILSHDLSCYDTREKCLFRFHNFASRYFHFKYVEYMPDGRPRRKDRCKDKVLFKLSPDECAYKPIRLTMDEEPTRTDKILCNRLSDIVADVDQYTDVRQAARVLLVYFARHKRMADAERAAQVLLIRRYGMETAVQ